VVVVSVFVIFGALSSSLLPPSDNYVQNILMLSYVAAFMLLLFCAVWLCFRFKTHGYRWDFEDDEGNHFYPRPNLGPVFFVVVIALPCAVLCVRCLFASVDGVVQSEHISRTFIGLVLLPISAHASNHIQTFVNARKNKMSQAIEMTLGASVNITLVTLPVLILTGWAVQQPMSMQFQPLETIILAGGVFLTVSVVSDGKSNYFEGLMCLGMYIIVILTYALYPDVADGP